MPNNAVYTKEFAVKLYETMCTIRKFEECVKHDFLAGEIPGFTHSYIGEEAIATGVCAALRDDDVIESPTAAMVTAWPRAPMSTA